MNFFSSFSLQTAPGMNISKFILLLPYVKDDLRATGLKVNPKLKLKYDLYFIGVSFILDSFMSWCTRLYKN